EQAEGSFCRHRLQNDGRKRLNMEEEERDQEATDTEDISRADLLVVETTGDDQALPTRFTRLAEKAREHVENSKAQNTRRAYKSSWADFTEWCRRHRVCEV